MPAASTAIPEALSKALSELEREPDAVVFFHDYHLYLAPRFVRDEAPDAALVHFVHIPWPQRDYWNVLPQPIRAAIHDGVARRTCSSDRRRGRAWSAG